MSRVADALSAMLDGPRAYSRQAIRRLCRYLELRNHGSGVDTRPTTSGSRVTPESTSKNVRTFLVDLLCNCNDASSIQEDPPTLDREGGVFKYSRAFKEIIDSCLVKDPTKRWVYSLLLSALRAKRSLDRPLRSCSRHLSSKVPSLNPI